MWVHSIVSPQATIEECHQRHVLRLANHSGVGNRPGWRGRAPSRRPAHGPAFGRTRLRNGSRQWGLTSLGGRSGSSLADRGLDGGSAAPQRRVSSRRTESREEVLGEVCSLDRSRLVEAITGMEEQTEVAPGDRVPVLRAR